MLKSEVAHQYWLTKKSVQRRLGSKEDEHIISSDAELDAKIEIFKSIAETSADLSKIVELYQERLCVLSQEECMFGRFLKDAGKRSRTTGDSVANTGKAMTSCGQQRMALRVPLLRLLHELQVFRHRAIKDTDLTLAAMEKERTEYRAALCWMKSSSAELDPDTGRGLEKFRTAQTHVRAAKASFDSYALDCIQKIDLLAAARCNTYSQVLAAYMRELRQFAEKATTMLDTIAMSLTMKPKYDFCVLKELTQHEDDDHEPEAAQANIKNANEQVECAAQSTELTNQQTPTAPLDLLFEDIPIAAAAAAQSPSPTSTSMLGENEALLLALNNQFDGLTASSLIDAALPDAGAANAVNKHFWSSMLPSSSSSSSSQSTAFTAKSQSANTMPIQRSKPTTSSNASKAWMELFAELDPIANAKAFDLKLSGGRSNAQQT